MGASCCSGGRGDPHNSPTASIPQEGLGKEFGPLANDVADRGEFGELIAFSMTRAYQIFQTRFEDYLHRPLAMDQGRINERAAEDLEAFHTRNKEVCEAIWKRYDEEDRGLLSRNEVARMTLDLLMEQRKYLPQLLDALTKHLLRMTKTAFEKVREDAGVEDAFVKHVLRSMRVEIRRTVAAVHERMEMMMKNYHKVADSLWDKMETRGETVTKEAFLAAYHKVPMELLNPDELVRRLGGLASASNRPASLFRPVVQRTFRLGLFAELVCLSAERVYRRFQQKYMEDDNDEPILPLKGASGSAGVTTEIVVAGMTQHEGQADEPDEDEDEDEDGDGDGDGNKENDKKNQRRSAAEKKHEEGGDTKGNEDEDEEKRASPGPSPPPPRLADMPMTHRTTMMDVAEVEARLERQTRVYEANQMELADRIFSRYDDDHDDSIQRKDFRRMVLDGLLAQQKHTPPVLRALVKDLVEMARDDARITPPNFPVAVPDEYAIEHAEKVGQWAEEAVDEIEAALAEQVANFEAEADDMWKELDKHGDGIVTRRQFMDRYLKVAWKYLHAERLYRHLAGEYRGA